MRDFYIRPHGRDKQAAIFYKFADWFFRKNRKKFREDAEKMMSDFILYGVSYSKGGEHIPFKDTRRAE